MFFLLEAIRDVGPVPGVIERLGELAGKPTTDTCYSDSEADSGSEGVAAAQHGWWNEIGAGEFINLNARGIGVESSGGVSARAFGDRAASELRAVYIEARR